MNEPPKRSETFSSFDETSIAFRRWGSPTSKLAVVFCSGIACDDVYWQDLAPAVAQDRLAITWDYPIHGDSGPPGDPQEITVTSLARHALALMDHEGIEQAILIGHSMGVQVMFETYRQAPERVMGMVPIAGPFANTVGDLYGTNLGHYLLAFSEAAARLNPGLAQLVWKAASVPSIADRIGRATGLIGRAPRESMKRYFQHVANLDAVTLLAMFRSGQEHTAEDLLEQIDVPVLIMHGTKDVMSTFDQALKMAEMIPGAELVAVEGGAHTLPVEDPELIAREVKRFLLTRFG